MFLDKVKNLFFKNLEDRVSSALSIEKSLNGNRLEAEELANEFLPIIDTLKNHVKALGIATKLTKSEFKQVEYISLLDKHETKLKQAEEEYYTKLGKLTRIQKSLNSKLDRLTANKDVNGVITNIRNKNSLEEEFNVVLNGFDKGFIDGELFSKSLIDFTYKYKDLKPTDIENIPGFEFLFKSFYDDGNITLDFFEKAVKSAQEKKATKVMKEFKAGSLKGKGGKVITDRDQAVAIAMSEAGITKAEEEEIKTETKEDKPVVEKAEEPKVEKSEIDEKHLKEMISEHERLIKVLHSIKEPSEEVKKELEIQEKELKGYKEQLGNKIDSDEKRF